MSPVYDYHEYDPPTISGYRVSERARVLVRELKEGGAAVSAAVAAGGNDVRVGDIRLLVGDTDAVMAKARDAAVAEATREGRAVRRGLRAGARRGRDAPRGARAGRCRRADVSLERSAALAGDVRRRLGADPRRQGRGPR